MNPKRGGARKVTREIADFIRKKHEEGLASRDINNLVRKNYGVDLHPVTITRYYSYGVDLHPVTITRYYRPWHEIIERYKEMAREQKRTRYDRVYHKHYRHLDRYLREIFDKEDVLGINEIASKIRDKTGIEFKPQTLKRKIESYRESGKILLEEIEPRIYKRR